MALYSLVAAQTIQPFHLLVMNDVHQFSAGQGSRSVNLLTALLYQATNGLPSTGSRSGGGRHVVTGQDSHDSHMTYI